MPPTWLLVDASYVAYYRVHALRTWCKHARKEECDAVLSASGDLLRQRVHANLDALVRQTNARAVVVCVDGRAEWRRAIYSGYKATRPPLSPAMRDAVALAVRAAREYAPAYAPAVVLHHPELEADDIVHYVARAAAAAAAGAAVTVVANDRDYLPLTQLAAVRVIDAKGRPMPAGPVPPHLALSFKLLVGDKSDNVPPVAPRVGQKTAMRLLLHEGALLRQKLEGEWAVAYARNRALMDNARLPPELLLWLEHTARAVVVDEQEDKKE